MCEIVLAKCAFTPRAAYGCPTPCRAAEYSPCSCLALTLRSRTPGWHACDRPYTRARADCLSAQSRTSESAELSCTPRGCGREYDCSAPLAAPPAEVCARVASAMRRAATLLTTSARRRRVERFLHAEASPLAHRRCRRPRRVASASDKEEFPRRSRVAKRAEA